MVPAPWRRRREGPRLRGLGHVRTHRPRGAASGAVSLGLSGAMSTKSGSPRFARTGLLSPPERRRAHAGENVEQQRNEDRDHQIPIGPVLRQELHTPCHTRRTAWSTRIPLIISHLERGDVFPGDGVRSQLGARL